MSLKQWEENRWLQEHEPSAQDVGNLLDAVELELRDARKDLAPDTAFGIAYNAGLRLCAVCLHASGYRARQGAGQHHYTIHSLPMTLGSEAAELAEFLDACRKKRNIATYESVGMISTKEVKALIDEVSRLEAMVREWLMATHPELLSDS